MAFWMAALLVLASGYPGMNVLTGVKAMSENIAAQSTTAIVTALTKKPVRLKRTEKSC